MKVKSAIIVTAFSCLVLIPATSAYAQCTVSDRYGGVALIARDQSISNLSGMNFSGTKQVCKFNRASDSTDCHFEPGGPMDDKINRVEVAPGCMFYVWEHPNYQGGKNAFPTGTWDDIQWQQVNDISSVQCKCAAGAAWREELM